MSDEPTAMPPTPEPPPVGGPAPYPGGGGGGTDDTGRLLAGFFYLTGIAIVAGLILEPYKDQRFIRHHAVQAAGLWVVGVAVSIVFRILWAVLGWVWGLNILLALVFGVIGLVLLVVAIAAAIKAWQGETWEVPVLYPFVQQFI